MSTSNNPSVFDSSQGIIFVDSGITDYQSLIGELQPGSQVHLLNSEEDGVKVSSGKAGGFSMWEPLKAD